MKPRRRLTWPVREVSGNDRHAANKFLSYDNYFHFFNCAGTTFASVSCAGLVSFQELRNGHIKARGPLIRERIKSSKD